MVSPDIADIDRIQFRTIRGQKIQAKKFAMLSQSVLQRPRMVITGIIQNHNHFFLSNPVFQEGFQETFKRFPIELRGRLRKQPAVTQLDHAKHAHLFPGRGMPYNRISHLRRNPHDISRTPLLKMILIFTPEVQVTPSSEPTKFFYMPPELPGPPLQSDTPRRAGGLMSGAASKAVDPFTQRRVHLKFFSF